MNKITIKALLQGHGAIFLATLFIAGAVVACKQVAHTMHPLTLTLLRFVLAAISLAPIIFCKAARRRQIRRAAPRSLVISFFYSMYFVLMFAALRDTSILHVGSIGTLAPLLTAIISLIVFRTAIGWKKLGVYLIAMIGTLVVVFDGSFQAMMRFTLNSGDMVFLVATLLISIYYIVLKGLHGGIEPIVLAFCTVIGGIIWICAAMLVMRVPFDCSGLTTWSDIISLLYLALVTTSGTAYLMQKGSTMISPSSASAYQFLSPVLVAVLGVIIMGIYPSMIGWIGAVISVAATALLLKIDASQK